VGGRHEKKSRACRRSEVNEGAAFDGLPSALHQQVSSELSHRVCSTSSRCASVSATRVAEGGEGKGAKKRRKLNFVDLNVDGFEKCAWLTVALW